RTACDRDAAGPNRSTPRRDRRSRHRAQPACFPLQCFRKECQPAQSISRMTPLSSLSTAYLAAAGYLGELAEELGPVARVHGGLLIAAGPRRPAAWAANVWLDPQPIKVASISDAAAKLRAIQRNWTVYAPQLHRRAMLIQEQLPKVSAKR